MPEVDIAEIARTEWVIHFRRRVVWESPGVAHGDAGLPAEFSSKSDRVIERPSEHLVEKVGLVEEVLAVRRVVVGRAIECRAARVHRTGQGPVTGINVLVKFIEFRIE